MPSNLERDSVLRAHPELGNVLDSIAARDWVAVREVIEGAATTSDRNYLGRFVAQTDGARACVEPAAESDPVAGALLARMEIAEAWEVRSGLRAKYVEAEQFREFHDRLFLVEQRLTRIIARHPDCGDAWIARLLTARGLQVDHSEARRRWARVVALAPGDFWAHSSMLQYWAPKWYGSWELLFGFAYESSMTAPDGSPLHALYALAQVERWLETESDAAALAHLSAPEVLGPLVDSARRSVGNPDFRRGYGWFEIENAYAMLFSIGRAQEYAAFHFRNLDGLVSDAPWHYLAGEIGTSFGQYRNRALAAGTKS